MPTEITSNESTEPPSSSSDPPSTPPAPYRTAWPWVLCVVGLDYLSTLAYQPSVAFGAAGRLAPLVTVLVVVVTLFIALPIYLYIAGRSPHGGGSTALLERVITGWFGKFLLLVLLAFGAVDLVFTRTFSAAAAAEHVTQSPVPEWQQTLDAATRGGEAFRQSLPDWLRTLTEGMWNRQTMVTLIVLALGTIAGLIFFKGYTRGFVRLAVTTVVFYLVLTAFVIGNGIGYLADHPQLLEQWWADVWAGNWKPGAEAKPVADWGGLLGACLPMFPVVALGLSGFELALMAMPLVRGRPDDNPAHPRGQIRNTRILLVRCGDHHVGVAARLDSRDDDADSARRATRRWAGEVPCARVSRSWRNTRRWAVRQRDASGVRSRVWRDLRREHGRDPRSCGVELRDDAGIVDSAVSRATRDGIQLVGETRRVGVALHRD